MEIAYKKFEFLGALLVGKHIAVPIVLLSVQIGRRSAW